MSGLVFAVGSRVRLHPACDWFMRGERYATVQHLSRVAGAVWRVRVQGERSGRVFVVRPNDVLEVISERE